MNDPSRLDAIATRWSLVQEAHAAGRYEEASAARRLLVLRYAKSIRRYIGGMVRNPEDADELSQDVVVRLMKGDFDKADAERGRFRDLLKTAVRNMVLSHWAKSNRRKTKSVEMEALSAADAPDPAWESAFQSNVLEHAWSALKQIEAKSPASAAHTILRFRTDFPDADGEELAAKVSAKLKNPIRADAARQMLRRARLRFAEALLTEVKLGLADPKPARVMDELAALGLLEYVKDFLPDDWNEKGELSGAAEA